MDALGTHEVTQLLVAWSDGDEAALDRLAPLVNAELHRLAKALHEPGTRGSPAANLGANQ